jgi:hypothetical protein
VVLEYHTVLRQPLMGWQVIVFGKFIRAEMAFLIRQDE